MDAENGINRIKLIKKAVKITTATIIIVAVCYYVFFYIVLKKWEPGTSLKETSTEPVLYETLKEMKKKMGDSYPESLEIIQKTLNVSDAEFEKTFITIPGMSATKTLNKNSTTEMCTSMTPQGFVATDDGMFISAYCHTHIHRSVIYYLDTEGNLISTITLDSESHVGGLAYDSVNEILWVSERKSGNTALGGLNLSTIGSYSDKSGKPIKYDQLVKLKGIKAASYITYYKNAIWAGVFNKKSQGQVMQFAISEGGKLDGNKDLAFDTDEKIQGMYICDDYAVVSKSYGLHKSKILVFPRIEFEHVFSDMSLGESYAMLSIETSPKLEQICAYNGKLYLLYESSALAYRFKGVDNIDRVITYDLKTFSDWAGKTSEEYLEEIGISDVAINRDILEEVVDENK